MLIATTLAAPAHAAGVQCGDVITTDVSLRTDLVCAGDGLVIDAGDLVVDLHGHTIRGSGGGVGIRYADGSAPHVDADVVNGTITNFGVGISLATGDSGVLIKYVDLVDNGAGVLGSEVTDVQIRGGELTANPVAVAMDGSTNVVLASLRVSGGVVSAVNGGAGWAVKGSILTDSFIDFSEVNGSSVANSRLTDTPVSISQANSITVLNNDMVGSRISYSSGFDGVIRGNRFSRPAGGVTLDISSGITTLEIERNTFRGTAIGVSIVRDTLLELVDLTISYNIFDNNGAAGVFVQAGTGPSGPFVIHDNQLRRNGFASGGLTDGAGRPVNDGLHTNLPLGSGVAVAANRTTGNADHGIEALPAGSVVDGGRNTSSDDPAGCAGVVCL